MATTTRYENETLQALSLLTLAPERASGTLAFLETLDPSGREDLFSLADSNHVVVRSFAALLALGPSPDLKSWIEQKLSEEHGRITNALKHMELITGAMESCGCPVAVMKTLDHWPDIGNDIDLYCTAPDDKVVGVMVGKLGARSEPRSWGDRLAHKWNFRLESLRESVEVHVQRLGQTGEHTALAKRFVTRRVNIERGGYTFLVPAPEERIIVATLQRMYRHFYFRVCDIVNSAALVESDQIDYFELRKGAEIGGIWAGVATYLQIVSDYVKQYRGTGLDLPLGVRQAAKFGGRETYIARRFIRVPIMPYGAALYQRQLLNTARTGDVPAIFRLSLLPPLAATAAVAYKLTGDDKGIW